MLAVVALNMGGPDSPAAVQPFLRNLFADPDIIQLGWARPLQPLLARFIARRRAAFSRAAYAQIGGRSPIREESMTQVQAVVAAMATAGVVARPYLAMSYWHPYPGETAAAMQADGITHALLLPLYPHRSRTTSGSALRTIESALKEKAIVTARIEGYATMDGYLDALCDRITEASDQLPDVERATAPVLFSAHGLPLDYVRRGDPYLDDIRSTVAAVTRLLGLEGRAQLAFQSRVGRRRWLAPTTEESLDALAAAGHRAVVVVPVSFTGEHVETLREIDILYRERAGARGITSFARARAVGCHPGFIAGLAGLLVSAAQDRGWTSRPG
jgi:ferrochelatase